MEYDTSKDDFLNIPWQRQSTSHLGEYGLPFPEGTLALLDLFKNGRKDIAPVLRARRILTRCWRIRSRMDMVTSVVGGWMSVPALVELSVLVGLVIVEREVTVFEPHNFQSSHLNALWVEPLVISTHQPVRSELRIDVDTGETAVSLQPVADYVESVEVDWRVAGSLRRRAVFVLTAVHTADS